MDFSWGAWVAQPVKHPTLDWAQVMISQFVSLNLELGSVTTVQSLLGILSLSLSLSASPLLMLMLMLCLSLSKSINKLKKKCVFPLSQVFRPLSFASLMLLKLPVAKDLFFGFISRLKSNLLQDYQCRKMQ